MKRPDEAPAGVLTGLERVGRPPLDVATAVCVAIAAVVASATALPPLVVAVVELPLLYFLPGYAVVTALFPGNARATGDRLEPADTGSVLPTASTLGVAERVVVAVVGSLVLLPVVGLVLSASGIGYTPVAEAGLLATVVVLGSAVGWVRRSARPAGRRFDVSLPFDRSNRSTVGGAVLVGAVLLAAGAVVVGVLAPPTGPAYTDAALLTETDDGSLVAGEYPSRLAVGESGDLVVAVTNHEHHEQTYSVVVSLQRVEQTDGGVRVTDERRVETARVTVTDGERALVPVSVVPGGTPGRARLSVRVYRGEPPAASEAESDPYRRLHLWMDVVGGDAAEGDDARSGEEDRAVAPALAAGVR